MGTNYYHRTRECGACGRHTETHICKSLTMFEAPRRYTDDGGCIIGAGTWVEWRARLRTGGRIFDEYGAEHDVEDFIAQVEATTPEWRRRQYDWMAEHRPGSVSDGPAVGKDWLDADGFSFCGGEFS